MKIVPNVQCAFEATFDPSAVYVGMSVYDITNPASISLVSGPTAMTNVIGATWVGFFTPTLGKRYLIFKAVYNQVGLTTLNTSYFYGSETVMCSWQFDSNNYVMANAETDSAQIEVKKNAAYNNFMFPMTDSSGAPLTGLTVAALLSKDGASMAAPTNSVTEVGNGVYAINFAAADTNCGTMALRFAATGAVDQFVTIRTQA